jgi:tetratricopeptide (TPR) repeat protein
MRSKLIISAFFALRLLAPGATRGEPVGREVFAARAEQAFAQAWANYQADTNSPVAACQFARACFDLTDFATNNTQRAQIARRGIAVCRELVARDPQSGPGHYYLGMNLGQLAQAEAPSLAAYRRVHEVEREFKRAAELDVRFDFAGPARTLGLLYFQAPGWPLSIGSKNLAREWLERAAALAPDYPENQLNLAEAQWKWRQHAELAATLKKMDALWPAARTNLAGETWQESWQDWDARRTALTANYQKVYGAKP